MGVAPAGIGAGAEQAPPVLLELQPEVLPKSPSGAAVRYALNQWEALTRFLEDGELEIDNGATERANRDIAVGRGNWTFFGSDGGGRTAAVLRSFIASCKRCGVEPFAWFRDVLSRIPAHSIARLHELRPQLEASDFSGPRLTNPLQRIPGPSPKGGLRDAYQNPYKKALQRGSVSDAKSRRRSEPRALEPAVLARRSARAP